MRFLFLLFFTLVFQTLSAQNDEDLVIYYSFDSGFLVDDLNSSAPIPQGSIVGYGCGVKGSALKLSGGIGSGVFIFGSEVNNLFRIGDFTLSFYFKSYNNNGTIDLISKRNECDPDSSLAIRYSVLSNTLSCQLSETSAKSASIQQTIDPAACWHLVTLVRDYTKTILYLDGKFQSQNSILSVINLSNESPLCLSAGPCVANTDKPLEGFIDELRIYDRALKPEEIEALYFSPDKLVNKDTIMYLGDFVETFVNNSCATTFEWSPIAGVANPISPLTVITPQQAGSIDYLLAQDDGECIATDTLRITVIDPSTLDCSQVFVPNAFTPNGDKLNSRLGISNPKAVTELISFSIFDRWGTQVFLTKDPYETWDGDYRGKALNSGVYLYTMEWVCLGQKLKQSSSVTMIR